MKRAPNQPDGRLHLYGGIYLREMISPDIGTLIPQHTHTWDHLSYVAVGAVRAWRNDELLGDFIAPAAVKIEAGAAHRFLTLMPNTTVLCIHASDTADIETEAENPLDLED